MEHSKIKTFLVFVIIFSLNYAQLAPCFAGEKQKKVRVAFIGIKFDDMAPDLQERIFDRLMEILESKPGLQILKPEEVAGIIGAERMAPILAQPDSASLRALAGQLQVSHVFAGRLANQSREPQRALLVGELSRFDPASGLLHRFEVLKYYENFGVELVKFKQEFVETIATTQSSRKLSAVWLVVGGVTLFGIGAMALSSIKAGTEGEGAPPPDRP